MLLASFLVARAADKHCVTLTAWTLLTSHLEGCMVANQECQWQVACVIQLADLVDLVGQLGDDDRWLPFPAAFPLSLAPACFACFDDGGPLTAVAIGINLGIPFYDDLPSHGYAAPPIMVCRSDGICRQNLSTCEP